MNMDYNFFFENRWNFDVHTVKTLNVQFLAISVEMLLKNTCECNKFHKATYFNLTLNMYHQKYLFPFSVVIKHCSGEGYFNIKFSVKTIRSFYSKVQLFPTETNCDCKKPKKLNFSIIYNLN